MASHPDSDDRALMLPHASIAARMALTLLVAVAIVPRAGAMAQCPPAAIYNGSQADTGLGVCVAPAGDVNADGVPDILLSEPGYDGPAGQTSGRVRVRSGVGTATLWTVNGTTPMSAFGNAVAGNGDLNGDGHDDIVVGAWFEINAGGSFAGAVYALSGVNGALLWKRNGDGTEHQLGTSVAIIGDLNNDGFDDVVAGQPGRNYSAWVLPGRVYVLSGLNGEPLYALDGQHPHDTFGWRVSKISDVDDDGLQDIVVGAPRGDGSLPGAGRVYLFSGASGKLIRDFPGDLPHAGFGAAVAGLDDVDGDGAGDIAVGAYNFGALGAIQVGKVWVYSGMTGAAIWSVQGLSEGELSGHAVGNAGDVNADGISDVIIGAWAAFGSAGPNQGRVYVRSGCDGALLSMWWGESAVGSFGRSVAGVGDINQDGFDDIMVGAPEQATLGGGDAGRQYLYRGGPSQDLNCDQRVNVLDLMIIIAQWGACAETDVLCKPDIDHDGSVNVMDLLQVINSWTD